MPNPFEALGRAFEEFAGEGNRRLSDEEREAINMRIEKRRAEEMKQEFDGMAETLPLMLDSFREKGVHKDLAKFMFEFYKELKAAGFTDAQAITIASQNFNVLGDQ